MSKPLITEAELHASVDGHLPEPNLADVEAWLREHPQDAERIAQYRRQNAALHGAYDHVLEEPVPEKLSIPALRRRRRFPAMRYAAVLAGLAVGGVIGGALGVFGGWKLHDRHIQLSQLSSGDGGRGAPAFARQAAVAHAVFSPEVRHPVEVGADQEAHLVAWLSKRLGTQLRVPHLGEQGFSLVGGRLLPGQPDDRSPVAQFMYQDAKGLRLTLYVRVDAASSRETAFRFAQEKNVRVFYWVDQKLGYALSGELEKNELLRVANAVYKQLNP
jgi:anti-sigma factor RsiW